MRIWRIVSALTLLALVLTGATSCNPFGSGNEQEVTQQLVTVTRGDISLTVTGDGRVSLLNSRKLTFSTSGKVIEVNVEEGDRVKQGQVLARLDTSDLELAVAQAELALQSAQYDLDNTGALELAVIKAQTALEIAKFNLDRMEDIDDAKTDVEEAETEVRVAKEKLEEANYYGDDFGAAYWRQQVILNELKLAEAQKELADLLADPDYTSLVVDDLTIKKLQVKLAELELAQANKELEKGLEREAVTQKRVTVAKQSLEHAKKQLENTVLTAPFDGAIAKVNVKKGDVMSSVNYATAVVFELIDPDRMELTADIDEIDIPGVKVGLKAIIEMDALPDVRLNGNVTYIQLLSKEVSGVVLYPVKIAFEVPPGIEVKSGMSASADIVTKEHKNVLLLPNRAITQDSQGKPMVRVKVDEQIEERAIVTGISDGQKTEIVSGLQEDETVVIERQVKPSESGGFLFGG